MTKRILITGGAGFIGTNAALYFLKKGWYVDILDNFSRHGSKQNARMLEKLYKNRLAVRTLDIRFDFSSLVQAVKRKDVILHLGGQVAVTKSVENPRDDFEHNALGTLNMLEAARLSDDKPIFIYSSSNKVYGDLNKRKILEKKTRYAFADLPYGVSEEMNLDFHSPYGCSKGAGDQYVRDYCRIYNLPTVVFRQSCIYGQYQYGREDQGWLAWFMIAVSQGKPTNIFGKGKQVRDILHVDDLISAYDLAIGNIKKTKGEIYNIGGGNKNTISVWMEFKPQLERLFHKQISATFYPARPGDQKIYVSDIRKSKDDFNWEPMISVNHGLKLLHEWVKSNDKNFL